ncbi:hypothetical protein GN316_04130 [Xylophilus sp. Kf1]|nr:hypothetical protein [Xylophilus sp. Kf1]
MRWRSAKPDPAFSTRGFQWPSNGCTPVQHNMANLKSMKPPQWPDAVPGAATLSDTASAFGCSPCFSVPPTRHADRPFYFDAPEFGFIDQMLDIGGGTGQVASLLRQRHAGLKITVFDVASVCHAALDRFLAQGQSDDLGAHPGDFFFDPLPSGFPAAQFSHVLELFPAEQVLWLLKKAFDALPRGGRLFVYGYARHEESPPLTTSSWCLPGFTLFVPGASRLYSVGHYLRWLRVVGFSRIGYRHDGAQMLFLTAIK